MRATCVWRGIIALALALPLATAPIRRATATSSLASVVAGDVARAAHDDHAPGGGAGADGLTAFPRTLPITGDTLAVDERPGRAYIADDRGISILDTHTGARLRTLARPGIVNDIAVDAARRRVFIADFEGDDYSVYTFDARTAALLHTTNPDPTNVGKAPIALAVDGMRGRVYALLGSQLDKNFQPVGPASVAVIDAATGALRRSVNLSDTVTLAGGGRTFGIAVDTRAQRLIALADTHVVVLDTADRALVRRGQRRRHSDRPRGNRWDRTSAACVPSSPTGARAFAAHPAHRRGCCRGRRVYKPRFHRWIHHHRASYCRDGGHARWPERRPATPRNHQGAAG